MKTICCILALTVTSWACTTGASGNCEVGSGKTYSTISSCLSAMSAGQTCMVFAGTYNESPRISAGTAGNYNTLTVNPGDTATILGVTLNSHTKVNGFHIQNTSSPGTACISVVGNSTDIYETNNIMYACGGIREPAGTNNTHIFIQGNTLSYPCSTSTSPNVCTAMVINGDYHLIEKNDLSHFSDGPYLNGRWIVMRKNNEHDINGNTDCGSNSSNCHIDFMQADTSGGSGGPVEFILIENNTVNNWVGETHAIGLFQGESCGSNCFDAIVRFHKVSHVGGGGLFNDTSIWNNVKTYNNTYADINNTLNGNGELTNTFTCCSGGSDINDIFYFTVSLSGFNAYGCSGTGCTGFNYGHSDAFCTTSPCSLQGHVYGSGNWTGDPGNFQSDPQFVSYSGNNFALSSTSPARNAGTNLTTVNGTISNSTSLVVNDATYFQDGWTIPGVQGDCVAVTTISNHVCVTAVNYSTNTLTLASPISATKGDPVWIYSISDGTAVLTDTTGPDLGAFPYGSSTSSLPAPPTDLTSVVE